MYFYVILEIIFYISIFIIVIVTTVDNQALSRLLDNSWGLTEVLAPGRLTLNFSSILGCSVLRHSRFSSRLSWKYVLWESSVATRRLSAESGFLRSPGI